MVDLDLTSKEELKRLRRRAAELNRHGDWGSDSVELNSRIIQLDPTDIAAHTRRGKCHRHRGDLQDAAADYRRALELSPEGASTTTLIRQTITEIETEATERAEAGRRAKEERERAERAWHEELGRQRSVLTNLGDCDEAVAVAREARREPTPDTASGLDFALAAYRRAAELDPARLDVGVEWAALLRYRGHHIQARRIYERVLALRPEHRAARVGRAAILVDAGDAGEALAVCDGLLKEHPQDSFARKVKARAHAARGEMTTAVWHYENAGEK